MGRGRRHAERPTGEPSLLTSSAAQRWCDFGLNFKFGDIWSHWQHGAGALGSLDAQTSYSPHNDVGQLDGVSMSLNMPPAKRDNLSWPNCRGGGSEVPKHRYPVPDALRLSETCLREWQIEVITSRSRLAQQLGGSCWVR